MTIWILVLAMTNGEAISLTSIPNFTTKAECETAGAESKLALDGFIVGRIRFTCVKQTKEGK